MFRNGGKVQRTLARLIYGHIFVLYVKQEPDVKWVCGKKCNTLNLSEEIESPRKQYTSFLLVTSKYCYIVNHQNPRHFQKLGDW